MEHRNKEEIARRKVKQRAQYAVENHWCMHKKGRNLLCQFRYISVKPCCYVQQICKVTGTVPRGKHEQAETSLLPLRRHAVDGRDAAAPPFTGGQRLRRC